LLNHFTKNEIKIRLAPRATIYIRRTPLVERECGYELGEQAKPSKWLILSKKRIIKAIDRQQLSVLSLINESNLKILST